METKLRHLLRQRNITVTQAAKELGIKRETLQRKLSGQYPFYLREAVALHKKNVESSMGAATLVDISIPVMPEK